MDLKWLEWSKHLQAIAQIGLAYAKDPFDIERYERVRDIAAEIMALQSGAELSYAQRTSISGRTRAVLPTSL